MPRPYARKKRKRSGWSTQRATMQSIPRLTFKPMQLMRRSDIRLTCKINFGNAMYPPVANPDDGTKIPRRNGIWWYTINTNSIFPIHRYGSPDDPNDGTNQTTPANTWGAPTDVPIVATVWQANPGMRSTSFAPQILPKDGVTLSQMRSTSAGMLAARPLVAPGLFEEDSSPGYQYAEIAVVGTKITAHWVPLVSDLDNMDNDPAVAGSVDGMQTEEARLFMFPQTQQVGNPYPLANPVDNSPNQLIGPDSSWEQDIALLPYVKSRTITGLTSRTAHGKAAVNKLGNGAVLEYKVNPAQIHGTTVSDEKLLWSRNTLGLPNGGDNPDAPKFQHPVERNFLTIGICKSLKNGQSRCPPSGKLEIRIEQILKMREPMSTRTIGGAQNAPPVVAAGANPGGGGSFFPGNAFSAGRIGANVAAAAALAANFS